MASPRGCAPAPIAPADQPFLDEALVFAYQHDGSMSAPSGQHDDRIMATAIAWHLVRQPPPGALLREHLQAREDANDARELAYLTSQLPDR